MKGMQLVSVTALHDRIAGLEKELNVARDNEATWRKKCGELTRTNTNLRREIDQLEADKAMAERKSDATS